MGEPLGNTPKYAIVDGREATLAERIPHASASASVIVYTDQSGSRFYAT